MSYTYSITSDFTSGIASDQLHTEIDDSSIGAVLSYVETVGDVVTIVFQSSLSGGDVSTLNALVAAHVPDITTRYNSVATFIPKDDEVKQSSFKRLATLVYNGSDSIGTISTIVGVGYMDEDTTSYTVRIYDKTHNTTIAEDTFTNTSEMSITMTTIQNVPATPSVLELQAKRSSNKNKNKAYISSMSLYCV